MQIVFIINNLESRGGTERVASIIANELSVFYRVTILSRQTSNSFNAYFLDNKVTNIKFQGNNWSFINQCKKFIANKRPDIVIIHTMSKLTPVLLLSGIKAKHVWSLEHIAFEFHSPVFKLLRKRLYKRLDRVITLTESDAKNYPFVQEVSVIANPTPLLLASNPNKATSKTIVSIGRLTSQKGYDQLIRAWSLLEHHYSDWSLNIYGEGKDKQKLEQLIIAYNLKNIHLKGLTDNVQSVYDNAAYYVMSSRFEGLPVVLIEAQSRGLPIVSFDCPSGPAEIVQDGSNGYLVAKGSIEDFTKKMSLLIEDEILRAEFSKNALIAAKRFEPENIIQKWIDLIEYNSEE